MRAQSVLILCTLVLTWPPKSIAAKSLPPQHEPHQQSEEAELEPINDQWKEDYLSEDFDPSELEFELEPANDDNVDQSDKWELDAPAEEEPQMAEEPESSEETEIEIEPPKAPTPHIHNEEAAVSQRQKKMARMARQGQGEFETFIDPDFVANRMVEKPEVHVKRAQTLQFDDDGQRSMAMGNVVFLGVVTMCSAMAMVGLVVGGAMYYRLHKQNLAAQESEYPVYGVVNGKKQATARGDQRMAYSAQLHHYQQTKQKIISMEQTGMDQRDRESDASEDEGEEGDYSVYECPGLAPTGDIEVSNPMFEKGKSAATTPSETSKK